MDIIFTDSIENCRKISQLNYDESKMYLKGNISNLKQKNLSNFKVLDKFDLTNLNG